MKRVLFPFLTLLISTSQGQNNPETVTIGTQVWMKENLNVSTFRNGDTLPEAKTEKEWKEGGENKTPAWCYYNNKTENGEKYGKLYNWYAVKDRRGLAPQGYHLPGDAEWTTLTKFLGGEEAAGTKMKSSVGWEKNDNGTNTSGFTGLPGGYRYYDGTFFSIGSNGSWWSSTKSRAKIAWYRNMVSSSGDINRRNTSKRNGFSVRCIKD